MAKLTLTAAAKRLEKEKKKQETLKEKQENQKMKEMYGEDWKKLLQQQAQQELEMEIGADDTPFIYDFDDLYHYFDPVMFYKDNEGKIINMDFQKFWESEQKYNAAIEILNNKLKEFEEKEKDQDNNSNSQDNKNSDNINSVNNINDKELIEQQKEQDFLDKQKILSDIFDQDGTTQWDDVLPLDLKHPVIQRTNKQELEEELEEQLEEEKQDIDYKNQDIDCKNQDIDGKNQDIEDEKQDIEGEDEDNNTDQKDIKDEDEYSKYKLALHEFNLNMDMTTPVSRAKANMNKIAATYLNRFVPLYNKYTCSCCGKPKQLKDFYPVYNLTCTARVDTKGNYRTNICKECAQKLLIYFYSDLCDKNIELAMQYMCSYLNLYWDVDLFYISKKKFDDSDRKGTLIGSYISVINTEKPGTTFMNSPFLYDEQYNSATRVVVEKGDAAPFDWSSEDAQNKKDVIRIVGYDPFESVRDENDKKTLYRDFCSLVDEELAQDWVKCQSAITIVRSFLKVRQLDEKLSQLEEQDADLKEQKAVSDLKKKELDSITSFCANNGWSERFKSKVAKGETSFTGIMKAMDEKKYESAIANRFDIETSASMQQAADISMTAIMRQLSLSDAEVWKLTQDQYEELVKLRREKAKLEEDLRRTKYALAEIKLMQEAEKKNRIGDDNGD